MALTERAFTCRCDRGIRLGFAMNQNVLFEKGVNSRPRNCHEIATSHSLSPNLSHVADGGWLIREELLHEDVTRVLGLGLIMNQNAAFEIQLG